LCVFSFGIIAPFQISDIKFQKPTPRRDITRTGSLRKNRAQLAPAKTVTVLPAQSTLPVQQAPPDLKALPALAGFDHPGPQADVRSCRLYAFSGQKS